MQLWFSKKDTEVSVIRRAFLLLKILLLTNIISKLEFPLNVFLYLRGFRVRHLKRAKLENHPLVKIM